MVRDLVVVGASAGGVDALRAMVHGLPRDLDAAVLVVLHIPPGAPSALVNILACAGPLPTVSAQDAAPIERGHLYVAPADQHTLVRDGRIVLSRGPAENGHRPAIDPLFRSAARYYGPRVIGVILSGSRSDGTAGLAAIAERGGIAIVQDPDTALHRSMSCSAMQRVAVEHVLHPARIGGLVAELTGCRADPPPAGKGRMSAMGPGQWHTMRPDPGGGAPPAVGRGLRSRRSELHPAGEGRDLYILPGGVW